VRYPDSVEYLYSLGNEIKSLKFGLENVTEALKSLGDPQRAFPVVHVAGTNGKGSTCAMIDAAARMAGSKTGLYTSPHLVEPTERIQIGGKPISREQFVEAFERVHQVGMRMETHPTYFETVTAMAFLAFRDANVDLAIVEVGLGGRLDATNVVDPRLTVITPVDFDHEAFLGSSLEQIAAEKAGILKRGAMTVVAPQRPEAHAVISARADELSLTPDYVREEECLNVRIQPHGSQFDFRGRHLTCPLAGPHQVVNAATAAAALQHLDISPAGIARARWPGRLEIVAHDPEIILDGAHNPAGARALAAHIQRFYYGRTIWLIYGAMRDKSVQEITEVLFPLATHVIVTSPKFARALRPEALAEASDHSSIQVAEDLSRAVEVVRAAARPSDVVFVTGSLYLVGEARALLVK
jgi:dihydrofolate synthase / folylpolyglutamate synthase